MKTLDISGFGGPKHPYEMCCQRMLMRGLRHLKETGLILPDKFSIYSQEPLLVALFDAIAGKDGPTGAQMGSVLSHLLCIHKKGHEEWIRLGTEKDPGRAFDNGEEI